MFIPVWCTVDTASGVLTNVRDAITSSVDTVSWYQTKWHKVLFWRVYQEEYIETKADLKHILKKLLNKMMELHVILAYLSEILLTYI